jgi:hypothetical protein
MNICQLNLTKVPILFGRKSVVSFISGAYLVHNKKMNVHVIDSNSVMKKCLIQLTAKVMSNV